MSVHDSAVAAGLIRPRGLKTQSAGQVRPVLVFRAELYPHCTWKPLARSGRP